MSETVTITKERLQELEAAEAAAATIPILKEKLKKANHSDIEKLKKYDKAHPEKAAERSKRCKERNHEAYLARRRELYHQKKAALGLTTPAVNPSTPVDAPQ
jgi:hypothetical protein